MERDHISSDSNNVREFLKNPSNNRCFNEFFKLCVQVAKGYLRYLKARGFQIPVHDADGEKSVSDLAIHILGGFLLSKKNEPFFIVFDYFQRHNLMSFENTDPDLLYDHFTILLRGYVRKELGKIAGRENPSIKNLKRRFVDILKSPDYQYLRNEYIFLSSNAERLRCEGRPILYDELIQIVEEAFNISKNRKEWCKNIFNNLDKLSDCQNFIKKHELLSAAISVNLKHVELDSCPPAAPPSPDKSLLRGAVDEAIAETLAWARETIIRRFADTKKISPEESRLFLAAVNRYLTDFGHDGNTDAIPDYFREVMPEYRHNCYLKDYKYIFETIINTSLEDFKRRLRKIL